MRNYDFKILSAIEFEELSRDVLQKNLNITLESFKEGKDDGVDARYSIGGSENSVVVQAKCYKEGNYSILRRKLLEEVKKVEKLKPDKYILTTSLSLSKKNKEEIKNIFGDCVRDEMLVLGRKDMNNLLNKFPDVERNYFKLWISSTGILEKIMKNAICNRSEFERNNIINFAKKYVYNDSFDKANEILDRKRVVVISGVPGIGKTTLARALSYKKLADVNNRVQLVYVCQNINEAYELYEESKSQLFFFDDFLGSNFLRMARIKNEGKDIANFMQMVSNSKNKYLICTTREYILNQAKLEYEKLRLDLFNYVIDLEPYTLMVRAKILYNHLFFSNLDECYFDDISRDKNYLKIINHKNYSPRLIEMVVEGKFIDGIECGEYTNNIVQYLDNPKELWCHVFDNQISKLSQLVLWQLITCGAPIVEEDLFEATRTYLGDDQFDSNDFRKALIELEGTFIKTSENRIGFHEYGMVIDYQNPSVFDFLFNHLREHKDVYEKIFISTKYINQYFTVFSMNGGESYINVEEDLDEIIRFRILSDFDKFRFSTLRKCNYCDKENDDAFCKKSFSLVDKIYYILTHRIKYAENNKLISLFKRRIRDIDYKIIDDNNLHEFQVVLDIIGDTKIIQHPDKILSSLLGRISTIQCLDYFWDFRVMYKKEFDKILLSKKTQTEIIEIIESDIENARSDFDSTSDLEELRTLAEDVAKKYEVDISTELARLEERIGELSYYEDQEYEIWQDDIKENIVFEKAQEREDLEVIDDMFSTVKD